MRKTRFSVFCGRLVLLLLSLAILTTPAAQPASDGHHRQYGPPLVAQYGKWLKDIGTGNLGKSFWQGDTVVDPIVQRGPLTVEIAVLAIVLSWVVGLPVGMLSALRQNTVLDYIARFFTMLFLAIPGFWLGAMLVLLLWWDYAPPLGVINLWDNPILADGFFDDFVEEMRPGLQFVFRLHERGQTSSPFDQGMIKGRIRLGP